MKFLFKQEDDEKDCGWRCLYYIVQPDESYEKWLDDFKVFKPLKEGMYFVDIERILRHYKIDYHFTCSLNDIDTFLILQCNLDHGNHYLMYIKGVVYNTARSKPIKKSLDVMQEMLDGRSCNTGPSILRID